jgi:hypothetical protein
MKIYQSKIKFNTRSPGIYFHRGYLFKGLYIEIKFDLTKRQNPLNDDSRILIKAIW